MGSTSSIYTPFVFNVWRAVQCFTHRVACMPFFAVIIPCPR